MMKKKYITAAFALWLNSKVIIKKKKLESQ